MWTEAQVETLARLIGRLRDRHPGRRLSLTVTEFPDGVLDVTGATIGPRGGYVGLGINPIRPDGTLQRTLPYPKDRRF